MVTAKKISISADDLQGNGGGQITAGEHEATVIGVEEFTSQAGNDGWKWIVQIGGLELKMYTMFTPESKWKLLEVMTSLGVPMEEGEIDFNPNDYINKKIGVELIEDAEDTRYLDIKKTFPINSSESVGRDDIPF